MWDYSVNASDLDSRGVSTNSCLFCATPLTRLPEEPNAPLLRLDHYGEEIQNRRDWVCAACGWWKVECDGLFLSHRIDVYSSRSAYVAAGALKDFDVTDIIVPLQEVRDFLTAKYERRFTMHPALFEQTVGSVFGDLGYSVVVTGRSGDGGIDVILQMGSRTIGVQVKRYSTAIEAEQIRSLAGALLLAGITTGVFVTTSHFQRGAVSTAQGYVKRGYAIELVDADRFYDALRLAQLTRFPTRTELHRRHQGHLKRVGYSEWDTPREQTGEDPIG